MAHTGTSEATALAVRMAMAKQDLVDFEVPIKIKNDLPVKLKQNVLYFIGVQHEMLCPCGCKQKIAFLTNGWYFKTSQEVYHRGKFSFMVSITPTIHVEACGTYFMIANNVVYGRTLFPKKGK